MTVKLTLNQQKRDKLAAAHFYEYVKLDEENESSFTWLAPRFSAFCYGWDARNEEVKELKETLELSKLAIEALQLTQKEEGMGLLGQHVIGPTTIARIDKVLKE